MNLDSRHWKLASVSEIHLKILSSNKNFWRKNTGGQQGLSNLDLVRELPNLLQHKISSVFWIKQLKRTYVWCLLSYQVHTLLSFNEEVVCPRWVTLEYVFEMQQLAFTWGLVLLYKRCLSNCFSLVAISWHSRHS